MRAVLNDRLLRGAAISLRGWLPSRIFIPMRKTWVKLNDFNFVSSPSKREPMDPELQQSLALEFAPEVERLSALLGRDLTHWSKAHEVLPPRTRATVHVNQNSLNPAELKAT